MSIEGYTPSDEELQVGKEMSEDTIRETWRAKFESQETWVLNKTKEMLERSLESVGKPDITMNPRSYEEGKIKLDILKEVINKREATA